ncbi:hypothetical protein [Shewanella waksmanii]|uniref:hypothetical protein n=1 Tax=Shewanella waksmanii TaxID=213783 RepID=UPI0004904F7B|nr:hypothetical protein [Shewanella waksmanii]
MSVIRSVAGQWEKAEYAHQLQAFFKQHDQLGHLFVGATTSSTVCNLLAAMIELPAKPKDLDYQLTLPHVFHDLFQGFLLLFVKDAEHKALSQAEQLILSITVHFAQHIIEHAEQFNTALIATAQRVLSAMSQLELQRKSQRRSLQNMGRS